MILSLPLSCLLDQPSSILCRCTFGTICWLLNSLETDLKWHCSVKRIALALCGQCSQQELWNWITYLSWTAYTNTNKKAELSQGNRAMLFVSVWCSLTFTTSLGVVELRKPGFRTLDIPYQGKSRIYCKMVIQGHSRLCILSSVERRQGTK